MRQLYLSPYVLGKNSNSNNSIVAVLLGVKFNNTVSIQIRKF